MIKPASEFIAEAQAQINCLDAVSAKALYDQSEGVIIIDVRESENAEASQLTASINISRGLIEMKIPRPAFSNHDRQRPISYTFTGAYRDHFNNCGDPVQHSQLSDRIGNFGFQEFGGQWHRLQENGQHHQQNSNQWHRTSNVSRRWRQQITSLLGTLAGTEYGLAQQIDQVHSALGKFKLAPCGQHIVAATGFNGKVCAAQQAFGCDFDHRILRQHDVVLDR